MKLRARREGVHANVDFTPMIDVVFQLILFFLVSTTFAVLPGISLNLPGSETSEGTTTASITITAEKDGTLWFNDQKTDFAGLDAALAAFDTGKMKKDEYPVTLEADADVTNGTIVQLFDVLRKNDFVSVNLRTTEK